jgi:hypothetical protein
MFESFSLNSTSNTKEYMISIIIINISSTYMYIYVIPLGEIINTRFDKPIFFIGYNKITIFP